MKLIEKPSAVTDTIQIQPSDGKDFLRCLPIVKRFIAPNVMPIHCMTGRIRFPAVKIESDTPISMLEKVNLELDGYKFFGLLCLETLPDNVYRCGVDYFVREDENCKAEH